MTRLLITSLKIFFLLAVIAAAGFGGLLLADHEGWPRWIVAVALAGVFFLVVLVLFVRRYYFRRREEKFVKRVVDQDRQSISSAPAHEKRRLQELQERWTAAVAALRSSRLRSRGDPLYTLPWFMIFGETSSGKSTAVSHARLSSVLTDVGPTKGIASTRNCDWWFFEKAVILDTAGRYAVPLENEDREEWERFLVLLAKYRRKEPLNGLIVTLPADRLLADEMDAMADYGRSIRMRVDQLMRVLGAKFPVYVLITKIDLILGMTAMADLLPEKLRGQAMGLLNESDSRAPEEFLERAADHISRRLKDLRLQPAFGAGKEVGRAALFPDELERLVPRIRSFVDGAFHENPYQETPFLRGFFISSGRQSGLSSSGILGSLESFKDRRWPLPDTVRGLFLHDLFATILPKDRSWYRPLREYVSWRSSTMNLALGAWLLLLLTGIGAASLSYMHIRQAMQPVYSSFRKAPDLGASLPQDIVTLGLLRDRIAGMEDRLKTRLWPHMGLFQGRHALENLKGKYNQWFRTYVLNPTDEAMRERFVALKSGDREEFMARYLEHLVWRIDILKGRETGHPRTSPTEQDGPVQALALAFGGRLPYVASFFPDMYRSYVLWERDPGILTRERREIQVWANRAVEMEGRDLRWLVDWVNARSNLPEVSLDDFWAGSGRVDAAVGVSGAFTAQGREEISRLLEQVAQTASDPEEFSKRIDTFWAWYAREVYRHWMNFAGGFHLGMDKLATREEWLAAGAGMPTPDNPYFRLISRMEQEFSAVKDIKPRPDIARLPERFDLIVHHYRASLQKPGTLQEILQQRIKKLEAGIEQLERTLEANDEFEEYMKQLAAFLPATTSVSAAYRFSLQNYGHATGEEQASPVEKAQAMFVEIRRLLGHGQREEDPFWRLVHGPLIFLVTFATYEAACAVNDLWHSQVIAETSRIPQGGLWDALFGDQGVVNQFVSGSAEPFLRRGRDGWSAASWLGVAFPFRDDFLAFLGEGSTRRQQLQPKYTVSVSTQPTNVNREAKSEPYQTTLTLQCAAGAQSLDNFNFPDSLDFVWEPATCDQVSLEIFFRETTLTREWPGQWGFRDFLREFRDGRRVYGPDDFPRQKDILDGVGVKRIQVNYLFKNADPVLTLEDYPTLKVPNQAAHCWAGLGQGGSP